MNTQKHPHLSTPMRRFWLAALVPCVVFAADRAMAETVIIPAEFANREGSRVMGAGSSITYRIHSLYLGAEFPQEPIEIIGMRHRPKSGTPTQSPIFRDLQVSLTTTKAAVLNTDFVVNVNMALQSPTLVINGTVMTTTVRPIPDKSPRDFDYEFLWEETPFRFNPADGTNLLVDFRAPFGSTVPQQNDVINLPTERPHTPHIVLEALSVGPRSYDARFLVTEFIYRRVPRELPGDYNGNGTVEQGDLDLVLLNWGRDGATPPTGWIGDLPTGAIDQGELDGVLLNWGTASPAFGAKRIR